MIVIVRHVVILFCSPDVGVGVGDPQVEGSAAGDSKPATAGCDNTG